MQEIKDRVYVETEFLGCNPSFVVTTEGIVMIDTPQLPEQAFQWRKEIEKFGKIAYLINTDHHRDHALGDYYFDADMIMHEGTMKRLAAPENVESCKNWVKLLDPQSGPFIDHYCVRMPMFTYSSRMTLYLGEDIFELIHVRSHTADETLVFMPGKRVLCTGDTVCTDMIPSLNDSYPLEWMEALQLIEALDFDVLVPGHGNVGDRGSMRTFRKALESLIEKTHELISRGWDREKIVQELMFEDVVHSKYPPAVSDYFRQNMAKNIGRLYDTLIKSN